MDFNGWITAVSSLLEYPVPIANPSTATPTGVVPFDALIPNAIDYTENRLQRDLDLLGTTATTTGAMTANQRLQTLPVGSGNFSGIYVVATQVRLIIGGVKQPPLEPISRDALDYFWPDDASLTNPANNTSVNPYQWCPNDQATVLVGPAPASALSYEVVGTARFKQLAYNNLTNFLTANFPDLYLMCSLIFWASYQRDFSAASDDPKIAQSYENQYQLLLKSADVEEARKRFENMVQSPSNPTSLQAS